jgi:hypothetical protein
MSWAHECDCDDCSGPVAKRRDNKAGVSVYQRSTLTQAELEKNIKEENSKWVTPEYGSIEEYTAKNSKRFRMTKDQKLRNLSREEAFKEIYG